MKHRLFLSETLCANLNADMQESEGQRRKLRQGAAAYVRFAALALQDFPASEPGPQAHVPRDPARSYGHRRGVERAGAKLLGPSPLGPHSTGAGGSYHCLPVAPVPSGDCSLAMLLFTSPESFT